MIFGHTGEMTHVVKVPSTCRDICMWMGSVRRIHLQCVTSSFGQIHLRYEFGKRFWNASEAHNRDIRGSDSLSWKSWGLKALHCNVCYITYLPPRTTLRYIRRERRVCQILQQEVKESKKWIFKMKGCWSQNQSGGRELVWCCPRQRRPSIPAPLSSVYLFCSSFAPLVNASA